MKHLIILLVAFSMTNVYAFDNSKIGPIVTELQKDLTVRWDQKDQEFYQQSVSKFRKEMAQLQKEGMKSKDLVWYLTSQMSDEKDAQNLSEALSGIDIKNLTNQEAAELVVSHLQTLGETGSSYSGSYSYDDYWLWVTIIGVVLAASIIIAANRPSPPAPVCYYETYYDYWGYPYYQYVCY